MFVKKVTLKVAGNFYTAERLRKLKVVMSNSLSRGCSGDVLEQVYRRRKMKVVTFEYSGGTHSGRRTVLFPGDKTEGIAWDLDLGDIRNFVKHKMSAVVELKSTIVDVKNYPSSFPLSALADAYTKEGKQSKYVAYYGVVVAWEPLINNVASIRSKSNNVLEIELGKRKLAVAAVPYQGYSITRLGHGYKFTSEYQGLSAAQLLENLKWVLGV